jgi:uncharacterized protein (TIGR03000 family)
MGGFSDMTVKKLMFAALLAGAALALTADSSYAFFGRHGSCGSWGGGGSWGGSRGSWGSGGSWGGSYGSGGSWGSCGSYGGYTVSYSSCGSYGGGYSSYGYYDGGYVRVSRPTTVVVAKAVPTVKTRLTLHVPADAKVTLAGVETKQTGEVRQFATSKLASGQTWSDYTVVVETTRDGKTLREERTLNLVGGQDQDLAIAFTSDSNEQVALK